MYLQKEQAYQAHEAPVFGKIQGAPRVDECRGNERQPILTATATGLGVGFHKKKVGFNRWKIGSKVGYIYFFKIYIYIVAEKKNGSNRMEVSRSWTSFGLDQKGGLCSNFYVGPSTTGSQQNGWLQTRAKWVGIVVQATSRKMQKVVVTIFSHVDCLLTIVGVLPL